MTRSRKRGALGLCLAGAALLTGATPAAAVSPTVDVWTVHREVPFVDCPGFATIGAWDITHRLTVFSDASGVPIRDTERVDFVGEIRNATTGASVPDSGSRIFFDTLAPDGSFLETYSNELRHSRYVHVAGRVNWQTGEQVGVNGFDADGIAALCAALGG